MTANDCKPSIDPLKLIHQGTSQDQRISEQLDPGYAQVDERKIENAVVFAKAYAKYLQFYGNNNTATGDWEVFFSQDVSVQLAIAAIQDVEYYKINVKESFNFLNNREHKDEELALKKHLGYLFSYVGTLARQLEQLKDQLPGEIKLKLTLRNLIQAQLAPALTKLIGYHKAFPSSDNDFATAQPDFVLFGVSTTVFDNVYGFNFSKDWMLEDKPDWQSYTNNIDADSSAYGTPPSADTFTRLNHIATHNQFTAIFDQFLKVFARVVIEAKTELEKTFSNWDKHEPHYALFLSFLKLFDHARAETNTLTQRHLDFYYRDILKLKEKPAEHSHAHLLIELAKHVEAHEIKANALFKAGKDALGIDVFFANQQDFIANQAKVTALKTLYRAQDASLPNDIDRLFASPKADSADGLGSKLTTVDQSWHPFFNKSYQDGKLTEITMPQANIGFALASHYLWMAEGTRTITVEFTLPTGIIAALRDSKTAIICLLSTEKSWFEITATTFVTESGVRISKGGLQGVLKLQLSLSGADPAITGYSSKIHGYDFSTNLPILLVKLRHQDEQAYIYALMQNLVVENIVLTVDVTGLRSLAVSNDFGPVDTSKPFQPFGASPVKGSSLIIGCKEAFQKQLANCTVTVEWQNTPTPYGSDTIVKAGVDYLQAGHWLPSNISVPIGNVPLRHFERLTAISGGTTVISSQSTPPPTSIFGPIDFNTINPKPFIDAPDLSEQKLFSNLSRYGYLRLKLDNNFGQEAYDQAFIDYIKSVTDTDPDNDLPKPVPPSGPFITQLTLAYSATQQFALDDTTAQTGRFFHVTPFGHAEQKTSASKNTLDLLPQFKSIATSQASNHEAEFYIGITGLKPAQNLALLFQVADGSADPLVTKPKPHIQWSYLSNNEWQRFEKHDVQDGTDDLINSGIITFAIPNKATATNTLLPTGQHWLRAAVTEKSEAVCKLLAVSAQSLQVTFQNQNNAPSFLLNALPAETISKLKQPDAAVKKVMQPFASFGGRASEQPETFYTRVSERLRHKDRSITLWDYEHLILEAFPQIYRVKCLNHTQYEPDETGVGIYNELAPGHVTIVTIPNQQYHNLHDPLRPYTSLGLLAEIEAFLQKKLSCFVKLHVKNPLFEEVRVAFKVKFYEGFDETFYVKTLDTAITRFLSPWAFSDGTNPTFGGKVYLSTLINFVEGQPYVDYVTDFSFIKPDGDLLHVTEIEGSKAVSILVSAQHHHINAINLAEEDGAGETCPCASL